MHTDASHRFERGADHDAIPEALALRGAAARRGGAAGPWRRVFSTRTAR